MATQNALVRLELPGFPSTAAMTTNITQLTIDLAPLVRGKGDPTYLARARRGASLTFPSVAGFVAGCAADGFLELYFGLGALVLPVVLGATAIPLGELVEGGCRRDLALESITYYLSDFLEIRSPNRTNRSRTYIANLGLTFSVRHSEF